VYSGEKTAAALEDKLDGVEGRLAALLAAMEGVARVGDSDVAVAEAVATREEMVTRPERDGDRKTAGPA
jgi:hypothetical protein